MVVVTACDVAAENVQMGILDLVAEEMPGVELGDQGEAAEGGVVLERQAEVSEGLVGTLADAFVDLHVKIQALGGKEGVIHVVERQLGVGAPGAVFQPLGVAGVFVLLAKMGRGGVNGGLGLQADLGLDVAEMELGDVQAEAVLVESQGLCLRREEHAVFGAVEVVRQVEVGQRDAGPGEGVADPRVEAQPRGEVVTPAGEAVLAQAEVDDGGGALLGVVVEADGEAVGLREVELIVQVEVVVGSGVAKVRGGRQPVFDTAEMAGALEGVQGALQVGSGDGLAEP